LTVAAADRLRHAEETTMPRPATLACAVLSLIACNGMAPTAAANAAVSFHLDAPLCSMSLPVRFSIDGVVVGVDTFRVNLAPNHLDSRTFPTTAGPHVLGAYAFTGTWRDSTVTVRSDAVTVDTLGFYCS
jgi:hypothetical protein